MRNASRSGTSSVGSRWKAKSGAPKISRRDWLATGISVLALSVSFLNFGYTNLFIDSRAQAKVVRLDIRTVEEKTVFVVGIILLNGGNRPLIVAEADVVAREANDLSKGGRSWPVTNTDGFPVYVEPRQSKLIELVVPEDEILQEYDRAVITADAKQPAGTRHLYPSLSFHAVDGAGNDYFSDHLPFIDMWLMREGITSWGPPRKNEDGFPFMDLLINNASG